MVIKLVDSKGVLTNLKKDFNFNLCLDDPQVFNAKGVSLIILHTNCSSDWCKHAKNHLHIDYLFISREPANGLPSTGDLSICKENCFVCEYRADELYSKECFKKFIKEYKEGNRCWDLLKYPSPEHLIALYLLDIPFTNPPAEGFKENFEKSAKQIWESIRDNAVEEFDRCKNRFGRKISYTDLPNSWENHEQRKQCIAEVLSNL